MADEAKRHPEIVTHNSDQPSQEALLASEARFRAVSDAANDAIIASTSAGRIFFWNPAAARMFGISEEDALGQPLEILMPQRYRESHRAGLAMMVKTGQAKLAGRTVSLYGLRRDGTEFPLDLSLGSFRSGLDLWFTAVIRDTSERVREEKERAWLVDTVTTVSHEDGMIGALRAALEKICDLTGWAYGDAWIPHRKRGVLERCEAAVLRDERARPFAELSARSVFPLGAGLPGRVWESRQAEWVADVRYDSNFPRGAVAREIGIKFGAAFPIVVGDSVAAIIEFNSFEAREEDLRLAQLVRLVAEQLGAVIGQKQSEDRLHARVEHTAALIRAQQEIAEAGSDRRHLMLTVAHWARRLTLADTGSIGTIVGDQVVYLTPREGSDKVGEASFPVRGSVAEQALETHTAIKCDECETDERINRAAAMAAGLRSVILVPFTDDYDARGAIVVTSKLPSAFTDADFDTIKLLAGVLTAALKRLVELDAKQNLLLERSKNLDALEASERRFRSMIENSSDVIAIFDAQGRVIYSSPANQRTLGYDNTERLGRSLFDLIHPEDLPKASAAFRDSLASPGATIVGEFRYRHKNGSWRRLSVHLKNLLADPAVSGIVTNASDITDKVALAEQLTHAQRMEAIGVLAGGVSHDFNNLLTVLRGRTEFLLEAIPESDPNREDVVEIGNAVDRASALTQQLLLFSRKQVVRSEILDLNQVISAVKRMLERLIPENTVLEVDLTPGIGRVLADERQLEQMLINLVVNARDAMPNGGTIRIATTEEKIGPRSTALDAEMEPGDFAVITVSDNGVGMDAETRAHAFEPFFTTKDVGKGTGLGLATVYGIVRKAGGSIRLASEVGVGTTFRIALPVSSLAPKVRRTPVSQQQYAATGETILLVEDDAAVLGVAQSILERLGYRVLTASSAEEALAYAASVMSHIDLVITDVVMPGIDGPGLAAKLRERFPDIRILYASGYTPNYAVTEEVESGAAMFIEKPFNTNSLGNVVRLALR